MPSGRERILIATLVVLSGASWWAARHSEPPTTAPSTGVNRPDYIVEGVRAVTLAPSGVPERRLVADEMRHYPDDNTTELDRPHLVVYAENGAEWTILANRGRVGPNGDWVLLQGEVSAHRAEAPGIEPVDILTEVMRVQPNEQYAETDQSVRILSRASWVSAVGLEAWFGRPARIKLLSEVRGHYVQN